MPFPITHPFSAQLSPVNNLTEGMHRKATTIWFLTSLSSQLLGASSFHVSSTEALSKILKNLKISFSSPNFRPFPIADCVARRMSHSRCTFPVLTPPAFSGSGILPISPIQALLGQILLKNNQILAKKGQIHRLVSKLGRDWVGIGSGLGRDRVGIGSGSGRDRFGSGSGAVRGAVGVDL